MKLLIIILLSIHFGSAYGKVSCTLSRLGVKNTTDFANYSFSEVFNDPFDPACYTPMNRLCSQIIKSRASQHFPMKIEVVHEITYYLSTFGIAKQASQFIVYKDSEWFDTYDRHYMSATDDLESTLVIPPKFSIQIGMIMEGGYTLECR